MSIRRSLSILLASLLFPMSTPFSALSAPVSGPTQRQPFALERLQRLEADIERYRGLSSEWPGYDLLAYTLVYADKQGEAYLLNVAPAGSLLSQDTQPIAGLARIRRISPEAVERWGLTGRNAFKSKVIGQETIFLVAPLPHEDPLHEWLTLLHEGFHPYQSKHLTIPTGAGHESYNSADDYAYTQVEAHLLSRLSDEPDAGRLKQGLQLYRAVRSRHAQLIPPELTRYRQGMDVVEGSAQYLTDRFYAVARPAGEDNRIAYTASKLKQTLQKPQEADRSRYYQMGSALSHLMDRLVPAWKSRFTRPGTSFDSLLAEYLGPPAERPDVWRTLGPAFSIESRLSTARADYARIAEEARQALA